MMQNESKERINFPKENFLLSINQNKKRLGPFYTKTLNNVSLPKRVNSNYFSIIKF